MQMEMLRQGNTADVHLILHYGCWSMTGRKMARRRAKMASIRIR